MKDELEKVSKEVLEVKKLLEKLMCIYNKDERCIDKRT